MKIGFLTFFIIVPYIAHASSAYDQCRSHFLHGRYFIAEKPCIEAAEEGSIDAQNWLGFMYTKGKGVPLNPERAAYWRKKSAEQGDANSQYHLGRFYQFGEGVRQDYAQALYWYTKAAFLQDPNGQYNLGNMYRKGLGVEKNDILAYAWYALAVERGLQIAQQDYDKLDETMTDQQKAEAKKAIADIRRKIGQ